MPLRLCAFLISLAPTVAFAETDLSVYDPLDMMSISRADFIDKNEKAMRAYWDPSMLLFSRLGPSVAETIPAFIWTDDYADVFGCMYDALLAQDALESANIMFADMRTAAEYIYANPDLNVFNLVENDELIDLLQPSAVYGSVSNECGLLTLNASAMRESGLMDAMTAKAME